MTSNFKQDFVSESPKNLVKPGLTIIFKPVVETLDLEVRALVDVRDEYEFIFLGAVYKLTLNPAKLLYFRRRVLVSIQWIEVERI